MEKVGFDRTLKDRILRKGEHASLKKLRLWKDVSTHSSRGYVRKRKNPSTKRKLIPWWRSQCPRLPPQNLPVWKLLSMSPPHRIIPGAVNSAPVFPVPLILYMWSLPTCEGDRGRAGAGDAGVSVWLGLAVGLGMGEGSSGGDGVFAIRRGPESLDEHRE